ncbi:MAG: ABC transporter substrate-binding protein [Candidatus Thorarchaeota archaeon]
MERNQIIALVVIIVIVGSVAGYIYFFGPTPEAVIIMGTTDSVETNLDPARAYDYFGWELIISLSSPLVEIEPGSQAGADDIQPALAESWTMASDGLSWDFTLRQNVLFEDGREFNASDVKYTFDRNCNLTGDGLLEEDGAQLALEYNLIIKNVTVLSEFAVRFNLYQPFAPFLQLMSCAASYIVDRVHAPKNETVWFESGDARASHPNGLGPFILESWTRSGGADVEFRLVKNPNYWNAAAGYPKSDEIVIKKYADATALATAMEAGDVDIAYRQLTAQQIHSFMDNPDVRVWKGVGAQIQYMCFNQAFYPFNETAIRQGIAAALNRTNVVNTVFLGDFSPLYSIVPEGMAFHLPTFEVYGEANYSFTQSQLALFGYNETNKLVIEFYYENEGHYPQSGQQAAVYKTDLEASGVITVNLHGLAWAQYREQRDAETMPMYMYGWYPDYIDPDNYAFLPFATWLHMNYDKDSPAGGTAQYNLWVDGRTASTPAERQTAYYDLQELQAVECSVIPLWQSDTTAVTKPTIHGVQLDITVNWRHWLIYVGAAATTGP